jgi:CheY-like chemotaxis protein
MPTPQAAPIEVLLVEDCPEDAALAVRAMLRAKLRNRVHVTTDGDEALAFLRRDSPHVHAPRPDLILLDLDLPSKNGRQVLAEIKGDDRLREIPVVVITDSDVAEDVHQSYRQHANACVRKPLDPVEFLRVVGSIEQFWLEIVQLR